MNYIDELNESQRQAVLYNDGPSLVIAGAGSGKTRVLTYKIAYLLEMGYKPWSILALTFTNKAAKEMKKRIGAQVGDSARYLWMGTFHSIFSRILRYEASSIGFSSNFTIYDTSDSRSLIKSIIKEMQLDDKSYKPAAVQSMISNAKNQLVSPYAYSASGSSQRSEMDDRMPKFKEIYQKYCDRCRQSDAMDFDDLLVYTYILFDKNPLILKKYSDQFRYILVDEYQDTNFAQHSIVLQLSREHQHVCVVGDDAQSIYSFRGANIENILKFTKLYDNVKLFKLEQNYRSTKTIVHAANSLIEKNSQQIRKEIYSEKSVGDPIEVVNAYSDVEEGEIVSRKILSFKRKEGYSYDDFAVLYRTNAQSRIFEEMFRKKSIPYKIYGGLSFYQRKEIKDIISYFRLTINPNDEEAFKRIINYPARGIGDTTLGKIVQAASDNGVSLWKVLIEPLQYGVSLNKGTAAKLQNFRDIMKNFMEAVTDKDASQMGEMIVRQSGIMNELYQSNDPEDMSRRENVEELINGMKDFCQGRMEEGDNNIYLTDYLSEISLLTDQDSDKDSDAPKVTLMTIHSAKGLEFKNVFVVGLEEELFPSAMSMDSYRQLEEERRLFYVAITRAEDHCILSFAKNRMRYGKMECSSPSRFLKDIDSRFLMIPQQDMLSRKVDENASSFRMNRASGNNDYTTPPWAQESKFENRDTYQPRKVNVPLPTTGRTLKRVSSLSSSKAGAPQASANLSGLAVGNMIEHERFGRGHVTNIEGVGDNCKATVEFENAGVKQLLLKFARFKIVE